MTVSTVAVTGGNGTIGRHILSELSECGYETVNLSRGKSREDVSDRYVRTDLLDAGDVYGSLTEAGADALIHMGTVPAPGGSPGHTVYESNTMSSYYLLEAAGALGIERVVMPSSINALGCVYQDAPTDVRYLPMDEDHPRTPRDPYAMSKHALEVTADGFGRKPDGPDSIATLRYPWVADDDDLRERFAEKDRTVGAENVGREPGHRDELFAYLHAADAARVARKAIETDLGGHEVFWTVAADTSLATPTAEAVADGFPDAEIRADFEGHEGVVDISKAEELLGWTPEHSWRDLR
jgi:nucleoside-diphosphate-sugar epimerase